MKKRVLGLALAAMMVLGNVNVVMAEGAENQGQTYFFQKVYQLTGGINDTAKSPAEEFTFESTDETPQAGKANLYAVSATGYNDVNTPDVITELANLPEGSAAEIPAIVKTVDIGTISYDLGEAKDTGNSKNVSITVPQAVTRVWDIIIINSQKKPETRRVLPIVRT